MAGVAEKKTEEIWSVTFTDYTDDYKPRGGDWSSSRGPYLFNAEQAAQEFLNRSLMEWCYDKLPEFEIEEYDKEYMKLYYQFKKTGSLDGVEDLATKLAKGEYVARILDWEIEPCEINKAEMPDVKCLDDYPEKEKPKTNKRKKATKGAVGVSDKKAKPDV